MDDDAQFEVINTRQFYTNLRQQAGKIIGAMQANDFNVDGGWITTVVNDVKCQFAVRGQNLHLQVGQTTNGEWMYDWQAPLGWVVG